MTIRMNEETARILKQTAQKLDRSMNNTINQAILEYAAKHETKQPLSV